MVKTSSDHATSSEKPKSKKPKVEGTEGSETDPIDMDKVLKDFNDDTNFDDYVPRCCVVDDFSEPYEVEYMSKEGVTVLKDVINIFITDPTGFRRVVTVWGKNALNIANHLK
jgi:hypothetical protein